MIVRAIMQARMGSSRLRGKSLSSINGIPLLKRVVDAILELDLVNDIVVATTTNREDDPIEAYCSFLNIKCFRGDENNVFSRFFYASDDLNGNDTLMRITADNIFYQKDICKQLFSIHSQNKNDYTGIKGLSHIVCELISVNAIKKAKKSQLTGYDKEHVTPYFINNPETFKTILCDPVEFKLKQDYDKLLTVDNLDDRERVEKIINYFDKENIKYSKENLYHWLDNYFLNII